MYKTLQCFSCAYLDYCIHSVPERICSAVKESNPCQGCISENYCFFKSRDPVPKEFGDRCSEYLRFLIPIK